MLATTIATTSNLWTGEYADQRGMRIVVEHADGSSHEAREGHLRATSDQYLRISGKAHGHKIEMFGKEGVMQEYEQKIRWSNNDTWTKIDMAPRGGRCPPLSCFSACQSSDPLLVKLLSDQTFGCIDFAPNAVPGVVTRPCGPAHPKCKEGEVVHNRRCVMRRLKEPSGSGNQKFDRWDFGIFRQRLVDNFAKMARPSPEKCSVPRIAIVSLVDYDESLDKIFGNLTRLHQFHESCIAVLTWQVAFNLPRFPTAAQMRPSAGWNDRPILLPDAYFLQTSGYTRLSANFARASVNVTKSAILEASAKVPWESKHRSVVWRGTLTSDVSGDRKRMLQATKDAVSKGAFTIDEMNIRVSEKMNDREEDKEFMSHHSAHMAIPDMIHSRGVFSVDGIGNEWTLPWKLLSNSVTLIVESRRSWEWYYPRLLPWKHYVPIRNDLSDFEERVKYVLDPANDEALKKIAADSTEFVAKHLVMEVAAGELKRDLERRFAA